MRYSIEVADDKRFRVEVADGNRDALYREYQINRNYYKRLEKELNKIGDNIVFTHTWNEHGTKKRTVVIKRPDGYCVMTNSDIISESRSLEECTRRAYEKGHLGYFQYILVAYGKKEAERLRKDPATRARLEKAGKAANAF